MDTRLPLDWGLGPGFSVESSAGFLFVYSSPLFEEEGDICVEALVSDVGGPLGEDWSCGWAGLSAYDYPVYAGEVQIWQGAEEGFEGEEFDCGGGLS